MHSITSMGYIPFPDLIFRLKEPPNGLPEIEGGWSQWLFRVCDLNNGRPNHNPGL